MTSLLIDAGLALVALALITFLISYICTSVSAEIKKIIAYYFSVKVEYRKLITQREPIPLHAERDGGAKSTH